MNWHRWLATLLVMLALAACAQGGQDPMRPTLRTTGAVTAVGEAVEGV
jgi:hypothetical protein